MISTSFVLVNSTVGRWSTAASRCTPGYYTATGRSSHSTIDHTTANHTAGDHTVVDCNFFDHTAVDRIVSCILDCILGYTATGHSTSPGTAAGTNPDFGPHCNLTNTLRCFGQSDLGSVWAETVRALRGLLLPPLL